MVINMTSFTIKHTKGDGTFDTYTSKNIGSATVEFNTPTPPMPLPQMKDEETILIKVEGNTTIVNVNWTVLDDGTTPFTGSNAKTAMEQVAHFKTDFVPVDVNDSYELTLGTGTEAIILEGLLVKMGFSVSGKSPVTWNGRFQFVHGNVQTQYDGDKANKPILQTPIANGSGSGEVTLTGIQTTYLGSESAITHYVVAHRTAGTTSWSLVEHATTQSNSQNITVDINATGSKDLKVAAKTTVGIGEYTAPVTVTVT